MKITVANLIAKKIQSWGIKKVFVFQGGAIMNVLSEIGKNKNIKYFCPYHEQSLAMAVDASSRVGKLSAGFVTSGPGATNLITGVACSYYDSVPAIFFSGQVGQFHITGKRKVRQRGFQESDIVSLFKPITKLSCQITNANQAEEILDKAFNSAVSGRPGPVLIDVPFNIQKSLISFKNIKNKNKNKNKLKVDKKKLFDLEKILKASKKPLIICGGGVRISNTIKKFLQLIEKNKIPFLTTWSAQDVAPYDYIYNFGSVGRHAHNSANILASEADLILTLGVRFSPKILGKGFAKNAKVISVDIDSNELDQGLFKPNIKFNNDLEVFLNSITKKNFVNSNLDWLNYCKKIKKKYYKNYSENKYSKKLTNPYLFIDYLSNFTKKNSILITDAGCNLTYFMQAFRNKENQRLISAWGNSPMGYSISAGIGAKIASPKQEVISLIGDGSFLVNLQDLQFIKHNKIKLKIIVIDNQCFGNTKIGCEVYNIKNVGNDISSGYFPPDIEKISKSFDLEYLSIDKDKLIKKKLNEFFSKKKASVLHVKIHKDSPLKQLKN